MPDSPVPSRSHDLDPHPTRSCPGSCPPPTSTTTRPSTSSSVTSPRPGGARTGAVGCRSGRGASRSQAASIACARDDRHLGRWWRCGRARGPAPGARRGSGHDRAGPSTARGPTGWPSPEWSTRSTAASWRRPRACWQCSTNGASTPTAMCTPAARRSTCAWLPIHRAGGSPSSAWPRPDRRHPRCQNRRAPYSRIPGSGSLMRAGPTLRRAGYTPRCSARCSPLPSITSSTSGVMLRVPEIRVRKPADSVTTRTEFGRRADHGGLSRTCGPSAVVKGPPRKAFPRLVRCSLSRSLGS